MNLSFPIYRVLFYFMGPPVQIWFLASPSSSFSCMSWTTCRNHWTYIFSRIFWKSAIRLPSLQYHLTVNPPTKKYVDGNLCSFHVGYGQEVKNISGSPLNPHFIVSTMEPILPPKRQHTFQRQYMKFLQYKTATHWGLQCHPFGPHTPLNSNNILTLTVACEALLLTARKVSSLYFL